jgi:hypothetical protein
MPPTKPGAKTVGTLSQKSCFIWVLSVPHRTPFGQGQSRMATGEGVLPFPIPIYTKDPIGSHAHIALTGPLSLPGAPFSLWFTAKNIVFKRAAVDNPPPCTSAALHP